MIRKRNVCNGAAQPEGDDTMRVPFADAARDAPGHRGERVALGVLFAILAQGFLPVGRFLDPPREAAALPGAGDVATEIVEIGAVLIAGALAVRHPARLRDAARTSWPALPVWAWCACSAAWSHDGGTALRRALLLGLCLAAGPVAVATAGRDGAIRVLQRTNLTLLALSLLAFVAVPTVGEDTGDYAGALRGVFVQKNVAAFAFQLAIVAIGFSMHRDGRIGLGRAGAIALFGGAIVLSHSSTALLSIALVLLFWVWAAWYRRARTRLLPVWVALASIAIAGGGVALLGDRLFDLLGRDPTFTGRDVIWSEARRLIASRPLAGYGFQSFWLSGNGDAEDAWTVIGWRAPHAHDGVLELLVEIGGIGVGLFALYLGRIGVVALAEAVRGDDPCAWWTLSLLLLLGIRSTTEPAFLGIDEASVLLSFALVTVTGGQARSHAAGRVTSPGPNRPTSRSIAPGSFVRRPFSTVPNTRPPLA